MLQFLARRAAATTFLLAAACGGSDSSADDDSSADTAAAAAPATAASPALAELTTADLDALERGLRREAQLVRDAQQHSGTATTAEERGRAIQEGFPERTITIAAADVGMTAARYRAIRDAVDRVLTTLDFQGKIDGPMSIDTANADAALRARLTSDPFAELSSQSAASLRAHMDRIVPAWIEYTTLVAVSG